ncbi:MAG TPA: response regulator [Candidatus Methylomirabilis sp.]|nr:response regulator [Candidatus Methylomirabilis sp.]
MGSEMSVAAGRDRTEGRILVVDDEVDFLDTYERLLHRLGYRVVSVGSRKAGLLAVEVEPLRLVITDLRLPDGNGLDIVRAARALASPLPVLVATVLSSQADRHACLAAGASAFLTKPFSAATLGSAVRDLLRDPRCS